jgi:hypothetical protein
MKIIIKIKDAIDLSTAMKRVEHVIKEGRVSNNDISFTYLTVWEDNVSIYAKRNLKSDTFVVYNTRKNGIK